MSAGNDAFQFAIELAELEQAGCMAVSVGDKTLALFYHNSKVYAVDNRCPHMGFPLDRGTVRDGILTCHWHHARFDLASGGTFDPWADDAIAFPVEVRDGEVWVSTHTQRDPRVYYKGRLEEGLERSLSLVIAKSTINLLDTGKNPVEAFQIGLRFGLRMGPDGWGQGLTIHTCMFNLLPYLEATERPRAMYHGLTAVAQDSHGRAPRFMLKPLPDSPSDPLVLKRWLRQFVEVRDAEGAERCILSALQAGADEKIMADMLFATATDHRYIDTGHPLDFTNKAFEALDAVGWQAADVVLSSLVKRYAHANRMEESNAWRHPVDLIDVLNTAFDMLPAAVERGQSQEVKWADRDQLLNVLIADDPREIAVALLHALEEGSTFDQLAGTVSYAAALRIARFHTSNEFNDWDTALHTFTFANAVQQGFRRIGHEPGSDRYPLLLRGVFDAAMSVYQDRFLNIPPARLPDPAAQREDPGTLIERFDALLDRQQQVDPAGKLTAAYLDNEGDPDQLLSRLGRLLLREDRDFHTIQTVEAAFRQYETFRGTPAGLHVLVAAARYLAAHSPTVRAQGQTYEIARRLARGDLLYAGAA